MIKTLRSGLIICLTVIMCVSVFTACSSNYSSSGGILGESGTTIELDGNNYKNYFDISVEYYNYTDKSTNGGYVRGMYLPPVYKATVSQRVKITPKSNVISLENVSFNHYANISTAWTYDSSNSGDLAANQEKNDWHIVLSSDGIFDGSQTMYYYSSLTEPTCPVPQSKLNISLIKDVTGTVTIKD